MTSALRSPIPTHLPDRLTICLWDFSWYTRAGVGEPYEDLDDTMAQTAALGYNTIRICAAPVLLFGDVVPASVADALEIEGLGQSPAHGPYGQRTRWYDTVGGYTINLRERFFELLESARRHKIVVILASWEYQQSPSFAADPAWFEALHRVPESERFALLAHATDAMLRQIKERGLQQTIAFAELHNEVDFSLLPEQSAAEDEALRRVQASHPDQLISVSYGKPPHLDMESLSSAMQVAQCHVYSYGVLDALQDEVDIREDATEGFPNRMLRSLQRADAPTAVAYGSPAEWKMQATVITSQMIYGYDWIDPRLWDRWLYEHYGTYAQVMRREIRSRVVAISAWARRHQVPAVVGEGWIGYTPRDALFEEGPIGTALAEYGIKTALEEGVWGMVLCSNAAPHHPMWADETWQRQMNALILSGGHGSQ